VAKLLESLSPNAREHANAAIETVANDYSELQDRRPAERCLDVLKSTLALSAQGDVNEIQLRESVLTESQFLSRYVSKLGLQRKLQRVERSVFDAAMSHLLLFYRALLMGNRHSRDVNENDADRRGESRGRSISPCEDPLDSVPNRRRDVAQHQGAPLDFEPQIVVDRSTQSGSVVLQLHVPTNVPVSSTNQQFQINDPA